MKCYAQKQSKPHQQASRNFTRSSAKPLVASQRVHPNLHLQRTIGNQSVRPLLETNIEDFEVSYDTSVTTRFAHDFSRIPVHYKAPAVQAKLNVNDPGDIYEQEANRVAEQVMSVPKSQLQRACACGGACAKSQHEQNARGHLQTKSDQANDTGKIKAPPIVNEVLRSSGQPLDTSTREFMELRFGHNFSQVRVHTGQRAGDAASAIRARAFTMGHDIVFSSGEYAPNTEAGRWLLSHELAHVLQQQSVIQRRVTTEARESSVTSTETALGSQTKGQQETYCYFELIIDKVNYCFDVNPADKPTRYKVTAIPVNKNVSSENQVEYEAEIEIKIINGKHRTRPTGVFKMCPSNIQLNVPCIWVDEVNFTKMMDNKGPKYVPRK